MNFNWIEWNVIELFWKYAHLIQIVHIQDSVLKDRFIQHSSNGMDKISN